MDLSFSSSEGFPDTSSASFLHSTPRSPLARRGRFKDSTCDDSGTPRLESLREETSEQERSPSYRPMKRRRIAEAAQLPPYIPSPARPTVTRSLSHKDAPLRPKSTSSRTMSSRVLRSQSQRLPDIKNVNAFRNVTTTRGRPHERSQSAIITSTPRYRPRNTVRPSSVVNTESVEDLSRTSSSAISASTTQDLTPHADPERVKRWLDDSLGVISDDTREVTSGMKAMRIECTASSVTDITMD